MHKINNRFLISSICCIDRVIRHIIVAPEGKGRSRLRSSTEQLGDVKEGLLRRGRGRARRAAAVLVQRAHYGRVEKSEHRDVRKVGHRRHRLRGW